MPFKFDCFISIINKLFDEILLKSHFLLLNRELDLLNLETLISHDYT